MAEDLVARSNTTGHRKPQKREANTEVAVAIAAAVAQALAAQNQQAS